ncbi:MAG TPA: DUF5666 domain-containing protein [Thermoanaerobaculia bacterium]|nr:DUF5666 domain-containing protein [Thermoanaerobaculia bacterium]
MSTKHLTPLLAALAFTACGSLGGIFGGPADTSPSDRSRVNTDRADLRGTVVEVNTSARRITLDADSASSSTHNLQRERGERTVYYDERTVVEFAGETHRPENLERGDEVNVRFTRQTDSNVAERITVLHDVRASGTGAYDADLPTQVRGTVGTVNTGDRLIEVDQTQGDRGTLVYYDERTVVHFDGREYKPENLERGDEIRVTGQRHDNRFLADTITVERDIRASSGGGYDDAFESEVRGTVRSMSSRDRLIQLDLAYGERGDDRIYWDERTVVELQGRQFRPDRLVAGDEIEVRGTRRDNRFLADTIRVVREAGQTE